MEEDFFDIGIFGRTGGDPRLPPPTMPVGPVVLPPRVTRLAPPTLPPERLAEIADIRFTAVTEGEPMNSFETMQELSENFVHRRLIGAGIGFLAGGPTGAAAGFVTGIPGGGGGSVPAPAPTVGGGRGVTARNLAERAAAIGLGTARSFVQQDPCPGGFQIPGTNRCFETPFTPTQPTDRGGTAVVVRQDVLPGMFGELSVVAELVQNFRLRCPPGLVLGKDERCYAQGKGGISNSQRKWPKPPRPILSAQDAKVLRQSEAIRGRAKRAAITAGFSCKKR